MHDDGVGPRGPGQRAGDEDEVLDTSSQAGLLGRIPARAWPGLALLVAAGLVVVALHHTSHPASSARAQQRPSSVASVPAPATTAGTRGGAATSAAPAGADAMERLAYLAYLADFGHPLLNNVRGLVVTPTCPQIPIGDDPAAQVVATLRRHLHPVALRGSSMTMNADATLCGLDVRARAAHARVVVEIVAPPHAERAGLRAQRRSGGRVLRLVGMAVDRWQITVGWAGPATQAPSRAALAAIAQDRRLRW